MKSRLTNRGFSVVAISGELTQSERSNALQALRDGRARVCVATDVAARGIDLPGLALVIHADLPKNKDVLLHRSGRTGRAGSKGVSTLVVPHNWRSRAERLLGNAKINATWKKPPSIEDIIQRDQERFLADPALVDPIKEEEKEAATKLVNAYGAEQLAAALLRLHNQQKPAPEELLDFTPAKNEKKKHRDDFKNGVWVSLSVGRNQKAEPRWLVPMLCGAGNMSNKDIGSIRIHNSETHIELEANCAQKLFELISDGGIIEKDITITRLDSAPAAPKGKIDRSNRPRRSKPFGDKKLHEGGKPKGGFKKKSKESTEKAPKRTKPYDDKGDAKKPKFSQDSKDSGEGSPKKKPKKKSSGYQSKTGFKKTPRTFRDKKKG